MKYEYGVEYPTNGKKPDLPYDVEVAVKFDGKWEQYNSECDAVEYWMWSESQAFRIVDERYKPKAEQLGNTEQLDESWHERGELPPVGIECEWSDGGKHKNAKVKILAYCGDFAWIKPEKDFPVTVLNPAGFRPIKSERESLIDSLKHEVYLNCINNLDCISMKQSTGEAVAAAVIGYMLDAGFRAPEEK